MCSGCQDMAAVQNHQPVGPAERGHAMGDGNHGTAFGTVGQGHVERGAMRVPAADRSAARSDSQRCCLPRRGTRRSTSCSLPFSGNPVVERYPRPPCSPADDWLRRGSATASHLSLHVGMPALPLTTRGPRFPRGRRSMESFRCRWPAGPPRWFRRGSSTV